MIDIHCHILPEVDDGPTTMEDAIKMAQIAYDSGTRVIITTSHYVEGAAYITGQALEQRKALFQQKLEEKNIDLRILLGNEAYLSLDMAEHIHEAKLFTLNHSKYLLVELPMNEIPMYAADTLYNLQIKGFIPIIAHPERYIKVMEDPMIVYHWVRQGCLIQANAGSFTGKFGEKVQETVKVLLKHQMIHFIGSDGHSPRSRKPRLDQALDMAVKILGEENARKLVIDHPKAVIENQGFDTWEPIIIEKKNTSFNHMFIDLLQNIFSKPKRSYGK